MYIGIIFNTLAISITSHSGCSTMEMRPMLVAGKAEFRYVVLVASSVLEEQFYVRFVHRLFLL